MCRINIINFLFEVYLLLFLLVNYLVDSKVNVYEFDTNTFVIEISVIF